MPHSDPSPAESDGDNAAVIPMDEDGPAAATSGSPADEDTVMVEASEVQGVVEAASPAIKAPSPKTAEDEDTGVEIKQESKGEVKLEDLFDDMDSDDDDFITSTNPLNGQEPAAEGSSKDAAFELLRIYYQSFFPWRYMFQWLNHSPVPTNDFKHREFSLWLHNDAVMRYQFRNDVLRLMPRRIEIGPVYTADPRDRKTFRNSTAFQPLAKELCFDIDLTEYDDVRTCCSGTKICHKCWKFTTMAIKVLDTALREDFGFKHILWVFSGRRGIHAWVCDKKARSLNDNQRKAITGYFDIMSGGKQGGKRVNIRRPLHPHLSRSIDILKSHFQHDVLETQDPWQAPEKAEALLQQIPDTELREALRKKWDASPGRSSAAKWADIDTLAQTQASSSLDSRDLRDAKQDVLLEHTYPRLDAAVSQKLNHLLKSPFVVHPGTGQVCVPIDHRDLEAFDPFAVPTLQGLVAEIDEWAEKEGSEAAGSQDVKRLQDWEKTSLKPYIEYFRSFVTTLMKDERDVGIKREREEDGEVQVKVESLDF
ncbi:hypothetical protein VTJ49DRAFT_871 [Mycothermus thermophilus]|uniref:DNA primase n=1 Tax=Humicola insolens TaxID=85995 RepID=A0ABR3VQZ9_HUMIN